MSEAARKIDDDRASEMTTEERMLRARIDERHLDIQEIYEQIEEIFNQQITDGAELINLFSKLKVLCEDNLEDLIKINDVAMIMETKYDIARAIRFIEGGTLQ
jgi:hypothetical protein